MRDQLLKGNEKMSRRDFFKRNQNQPSQSGNPHNPFGPPSGEGNMSNPFGPPSGGSNPTNPFGPPSGGSNPTNPFGPPNSGGSNPTNPFGPPSGGSNASNPFGPPNGGIGNQPQSNLEKGKQLAAAAVSSAVSRSGKKPKKKPKKKRRVRKIIGWFLVPVVTIGACAAFFEDDEEYADADLCYDDNLDRFCDDTFELRSSEVYKVTEAGRKMYVRMSSLNREEDDDIDFGG